MNLPVRPDPSSDRPAPRESLSLGWPIGGVTGLVVGYVLGRGRRWE